jgi:hypothetical protein
MTMGQACPPKQRAGGERWGQGESQAQSKKYKVLSGILLILQFSTERTEVQSKMMDN